MTQTHTLTQPRIFSRRLAALIVGLAAVAA